MANMYASELEPYLKYQGPPFQHNDQIYLQCYASGDKGYVGMYQQYKPGSTVLTQMLGNSRVTVTPDVSLYWATYVSEDKKNTEAMTFDVHVKDGKTWLSASKQGGSTEVPRELCCISYQHGVQYNSTRDESLAHLQFTGAGHIGFTHKTGKWGIFAENRDGRCYLNNNKIGRECVFVPEKVNQGDINWVKPFSL